MQAVGELNSLMVFPVGGCAILFGIVVLVLIDNTMTAMLAPAAYKQQIQDKLETNVYTKKQHTHQHSAAASDPTDAKHAAAVQRDVEAATAAQSAGHMHQCMRSLGSTSWLASGAKPAINVRQYVTAYSMELGCIFHSVVIGVGLGVLTESRSLIVTLMVALTVHQVRHLTCLCNMPGTVVLFSASNRCSYVVVGGLDVIELSVGDLEDHADGGAGSAPGACCDCCVVSCQ
jgi:zinc transporter 1/2/3